jgi:hypothetical protein
MSAKEFDPYSIPEWQRRDAASIALGDGAPGLSMDQVGKDSPDWYDIPEWQRTDALRALGFGSQLTQPSEQGARLEALKNQTTKGVGSKNLADALAAGDTATSYTPRER